jgi:hypothetical protein
MTNPSQGGGARREWLAFAERPPSAPYGAATCASVWTTGNKAKGKSQQPRALRRPSRGPSITESTRSHGRFRGAIWQCV